MKIVWTEPALQDLRDIFEYIAKENLHAARALLRGYPAQLVLNVMGIG